MSPREVFTDRLRKFHVPPSRGELPSAHDSCEPSSRCFADARRGGRTRNCRALERGAGARVHAESAAASLRRPNLRADPHPRRLPVLALAEDQRQPRAHLQGGDEHGHLPLRGLKARPRRLPATAVAPSTGSSRRTATRSTTAATRATGRPGAASSPRRHKRATSLRPSPTANSRTSPSHRSALPASASPSPRPSAKPNSARSHAPVAPCSRRPLLVAIEGRVREACLRRMESQTKRGGRSLPRFAPTS